MSVEHLAVVAWFALGFLGALYYGIKVNGFSLVLLLIAIVAGCFGPIGFAVCWHDYVTSDENEI